MVWVEVDILLIVSLSQLCLFPSNLCVKDHKRLLINITVVSWTYTWKELYLEEKLCTCFNSAFETQRATTQTEIQRI